MASVKIGDYCIYNPSPYGDGFGIGILNPKFSYDLHMRYKKSIVQIIDIDYDDLFSTFEIKVLDPNFGYETSINEVTYHEIEVIQTDALWMLWRQWYCKNLFMVRTNKNANKNQI